MGRFLKRLSSLCLVLVLSIGGLCNLNATLEDISLEGLDTRGIVGVIKSWQENFCYTDIVRYLLVIWLKKMGKTDIAKVYEEYMEQNQFDDLLLHPEKYIENYNEIDKQEARQKMLDFAMRAKVCAFFNLFTFHLDAREVGLYALIHDDEFAVAVEFVGLMNEKTFEEAMEEIWIS